MSKIKQTFLVLIAACVLCATAVFLLPAVRATAAAADTVAAHKSRNDNLVVKYSLDDTSTGNGATLTGYKWDTVSQTFVVNPAAAATIQNHVNNGNVGTITTEAGVEGSSALRFTGKAHARANFKLPDGATGMTVSMWGKNLNSYWASLVEFWDGANGGRFGKGTMQGNGGRSNEADPWSANCAAHNAATIASGGGWDSFVINVNSNDKGSSTVDPMVADRWYQLTYTITENEMRAYRDGVLKQTFSTIDKAPEILRSIMRAAKSSNGKLGIRLSHDTNDGDILDDFRIYSGAMNGNEVVELYDEYRGIKALGDKSVKIDGTETVYTINNGNNVKFTSAADEFPKILLGGVAASDVTGNNGTYSASGSGFSYLYTVGEYSGSERIATVTYTADGVKHIFTVTQVDPTVIHSITVSGGISEVTLTSEDFADGAVEIEIADMDNFTLTLKNADIDGSAVIVGASGGELSFTAADLVDGKYTFTVKSGNAQRDYSIAPKTYSANADLTTLTFGSYTLSPAFDTDTVEYAITLNKGEGGEAFKAMSYTAADSGATVEKRYNFTDGVITIRVTAENKRDERVYTIELNELDTDADLAELKVDGTVIDGFAADKTEYTYRYAGEIPEVGATPASDSAIAVIIEHGDDEVKITVTAESGDKKTYTVKFVAKSSDTSLIKLTVNGVEVTLVGEAGQITLPTFGADNLSVVAKAAEGASATYVTEGETVKVTVTAEDGTQKVYTVTVNFSNNATPAQPTQTDTVTDESPATGGCGSSVSAASFYAAIALITAAAFVGLLNKKRKNQN